MSATEQLTVEVDGCPIHARAWGEASDGPAIVLVHGSAAHLGWWEPIATDLADDHRVVALDLSGHGDSGWRDEYSGAAWAHEVGAVIDAFGATPTLLVGHSLGARVAIVAAGQRAETIAGLMLLDPPIRRPDPDRAASSGPPLRRPGPGGPRTFATLDEAKLSFHLRPNEPILNRDRLLEVAAESFSEGPDGWTYKADPKVHERLDDLPIAEPLAQLTCPVVFVYGAMSPIFAMSDPSFAVESHAGPTDVQTIRDAYHHLMFDHGPELTDRIRAFARELR